MYYYKKEAEQVVAIEPTTFKELGMTEKDIEELIKKNTDLITEDETILIIGQQVRNADNGICDLVGINQDGDLVLIEIKRDRQDIESRREAFEFQAIRYAASFATIQDIDDLINKVYAPYLEKNKDEWLDSNLTVVEQANRKLVDFFQQNDISIEEFNERQKIILVASDFDNQTKSAVAWLNNNGVEIACYQLIPYKWNDHIFLDGKKILPLENYDDLYVDLISKSSSVSSKRSGIKRRSLPRINDMLNWGVVKEGDLLKVKNHDATAVLLANGNVKVNEEEMSLQQWLKQVTGWPSVQTYAFTMHVEKDKTLSEIRREYLERN